MSYKLVKDITKAPDQQWYMWLNTEKSIGSTPDPRDSTISYTDEEKSIILDYINNCVKSRPGYIGWDREYIDDNLLRMTYYFATEANARSFRMRNHDLSNQYYSRFLEVIENKETELSIPVYVTSWALYDEQGNAIHDIG